MLSDPSGKSCRKVLPRGGPVSDMVCPEEAISNFGKAAPGEIASNLSRENLKSKINDSSNKDSGQTSSDKNQGDANNTTNNNDSNQLPKALIYPFTQISLYGSYEWAWIWYKPPNWALSFFDITGHRIIAIDPPHEGASYPHLNSDLFLFKEIIKINHFNIAQFIQTLMKAPLLIIPYSPEMHWSLDSEPTQQ